MTYIFIMNSDEYNKFINQDFKSFSGWLFSLTGYEFALIPTVAGYIISPTLTINEQNSLGNFFVLLGEILLTINAQNLTKLQAEEEVSNLKPTLQKNSLEEEVIYIKEEIFKIINNAYGNKKV